MEKTHQERKRKMTAIILVLIAFVVIWYFDTKEKEDLDDAISKIDDDNYY